MADWSKLPVDLLERISQHLDNCFDYVHFRSVCHSWRSFIRPSSRQPYIRCLLPRFQKNPSWMKCGGLCYIEKISVFVFRFLQGSHSQPSVTSSSSSSSSFSNWWVAGVSEDRYGDMNLLAPIHDLGIRYETRIWLNSLNCQILPLGNEYRIFYPVWSGKIMASIHDEKASFLHIDEKDGDFAVLTVHSFKSLAIFRTTDMRWRVLETPPGKCEDMVSFKGKFYAIYENGSTFVIKLPSLDFNFLPCMGPVCGRRWLVQSGDELLLVEISPPTSFHDLYKDRMRCRVFKLDKEAQEWIRVEDLGDRVVLLGCFGKFCCSADVLPGFKGNCVIVSTVDYDLNALVFDLEDGTFKTVDCITGCPKISHSNLDPAISGSVVARCFRRFCDSV